MLISPSTRSAILVRVLCFGVALVGVVGCKSEPLQVGIPVTPSPESAVQRAYPSPVTTSRPTVVASAPTATATEHPFVRGRGKTDNELDAWEFAPSGKVRTARALRVKEGDTRRADGMFVLVELDIKAGGNRDQQILPTMFVALDNNGDRTYDNAGGGDVARAIRGRDGSLVLAPGKYGGFTAVFDVPLGTRSFIIKANFPESGRATISQLPAPVDIIRLE